jgi:tRNA/tmRNA/rRNA uracil-C5-methylase (TrmA/RlmC/RlmD family)
MVLDLYCGVGVLALYAALAGKQSVVGIEEDAAAIRAAGHNGRELASAAGKHLQWLCGDVAAQFPQALRRLPTHELLVVLDPPRTGLADPLVDQIIAARPAELLYIACAPDMQARDLARLRTAGYVVQAAALFDMFPRTPYFEVVIHAVIER